MSQQRRAEPLFARDAIVSIDQTRRDGRSRGRLHYSARLPRGETRGSRRREIRVFARATRIHARRIRSRVTRVKGNDLAIFISIVVSRRIIILRALRARYPRLCHRIKTVSRGPERRREESRGVTRICGSRVCNGAASARSRENSNLSYRSSVCAVAIGPKVRRNRAAESIIRLIPLPIVRAIPLIDVK